MSAAPNSAAPPYRAQGSGRSGVRELWHRISEGRQLEDLWTHFLADARATYGFYGRDVDWEKIRTLPRWRRPFHVAKEFFWALLMKLTPARRVLLIIGLVLIMFSATTVRIGNQIFLDIKMEGFAAAIFLLLLALELADKVTMKRDLEIAREIQLWLVPAQPPQVEGADIAFATRPPNSVGGDDYEAF